MPLEHSGYVLNVAGNRMMLEQSTVVWLPVPRDRLLDAYAALATLRTTEAPTGAPPPEPPVRARREPAPRREVASLRMVNRAKARVKHLPDWFTVQQLADAMGASYTSAKTSLYALEAEGWVERHGRTGQGGRGTFRYVPAPEVPVSKPSDPPEVTGRGAIETIPENNLIQSVIRRGRPVAGTGRQDKPNGEMGHLIGKLRKQGWTVTKTGGNHYRATWKDHTVTLAATPSDQRAFQNMISDLRRAGAKL